MTGILAALGLSGGGSGLLVALGGVVALVLAFFGVRAAARKEGEARGELEAQVRHDEVMNRHNAEVQASNERVVQQMEEVHEIHDRLDSDPAYRDSVRERFTRD